MDASDELSAVQTDSGNAFNKNPVRNTSPITEQNFSINTLKKITFPISTFRKKSKARNVFNSNQDHLNSVEDLYSEKDETLKDLAEPKKLDRIELAKGGIDGIVCDRQTQKLYSNVCGSMMMPAINNRLIRNSINIENSSLSDSNINDEHRISYMNLLDLNKTSNIGLNGNYFPNLYDKTENCIRNAMISEVSTNDDGIQQKNMIIVENEQSTNHFSDNDIDKVKTVRTDVLNLSLMDKKKKLVDRIKKSIINIGEQVICNENLDLSIVKKESPENETTDSIDVITENEKSPLAPIERVDIKMEPICNLSVEDNLSSVMPTAGHFMALPVVRRNPKSKAVPTEDEGTVAENDSLVVHKLVCLICKKAETVSVRKSCIQGNIFLCKNCGKLFDKAAEATDETLLTSSDCNILDVTCIRCNLIFSSASEIELHNNEVHRDELSSDVNGVKIKRHVKPQYCSDCNKTFNETDEICKHIKSRRHKCEYCHKLFTTNSDLKKHVNIHTNEKTYVCMYCSKAFNSRGNMVKHLETHKERKRSFKCEFCNKTFLKSDHLKVHVNTHTNEKLYECPYCKKTFNRKYCLQLHVNIHTLEKIYECHFCNKICMDPSTLRKHIATHSDDRPFKCEFCDKTFKQKPHLTAHMKMHDIKQTFSCSYCDKMFFSKNTLRVHINTHTHEKTFLCVYCQKTFTSKSNLLTHINNKHTVDRTYNCSFCDKVFTDPSTVKKHENIHTNELTYQCAYCDKVFLRKTHLRSHINMHIKFKPYKCKLCDKSFAIKGYLKVHNNIHKGVKPFKCKRCGKAFTSKSNLILHTNSHTKQHLFRCSYCHKDFTQKANLKSHIMRSHIELSSQMEMPPV